MYMHKHSKLLFLAESSALAIKEELGLDAGFASSLHRRHKIAKHDLEQFYQEIAKITKACRRREFSIALLLNMAGAAYDNPEDIIHCPDLSSLSVKPHWDPGKSYEFANVYRQEPMNLWAGWSLDNVQSNQMTLDPHIVLLYQQKDAEDIVATHFSERNKNDTDNVELGKALSGGKQVSWNVTPIKQIAKAKPTTEPSPYSGGLLKTISEQSALADSVSEKNFRVSMEKLKRLISISEQRSSAGTEHYSQLLASLETLGLKDCGPHQTISAARERWTANRNKLDAALRRWVD